MLTCGTSAEDGADKDSKAMQITPDFNSALALDQVSFDYPQRTGQKALVDVSFEVKPGSYVALCGPSGSGKSTIMALIERFYSPNRGKLLLGNENVASLHVHLYRNRIALVTQEPVLYSASIYDNLLIGAPQEVLALVKQELDRAIDVALEEANIHDLVYGLPEGKLRRFDSIPLRSEG